MTRNDQEYLIEKIKTQYLEKEHTKLDALKELDKKVKRPIYLFTYLFGSVSALIMGTGMSLLMTDLGSKISLADPTLPGLFLGILGMLLAILNYPIYKKLLASRRKKYADKIIALSNQLMNE